MSDEIQVTPSETAENPGDGAEQRRRSRRRGRRGKSRGTGEQQAESGSLPREPHEQTPPSPPVRAEHPRPPEHARPRNSTFSDDLDRQICIARTVRYPVEWPAQYRVGLAVQTLQEVGRTGSEVLLCDLSHDGPCIWPQYAGREYPDHLSASEDFSELMEPARDAEPAEDAAIPT